MADWLRIRGEGAGGRLDVDDELTVGREQPGLGAVADDVELSRRHASFVRTESGGLAVEDLGSTNGTFVNGKRISGRTELRPGDVVQVGATELEVVGDSTTQESATPPADPRATKPSPTAEAPAAAGPACRYAAAAPGSCSAAATTTTTCSSTASGAAAAERTKQVGPGARCAAGACAGRPRCLALPRTRR